MTYTAYIDKKLPNKGGTSDYNELTNKPTINNVELSGNKTTSDLDVSYSDLSNKPSVNDVELDGNKTTTDLDVSYDDLTDKPNITPELSIVNSPAWGGIMFGGSITPSITLPAFGTPTTGQTFVYSFVAATTGATFTAPNDAMVVDTEGTDTYTTGNSLVLNDLIAGSLYECNFTCYTANNHNYIVLILKGYPAA